MARIVKQGNDWYLKLTGPIFGTYRAIDNIGGTKYHINAQIRVVTDQELIDAVTDLNAAKTSRQARITQIDEQIADSTAAQTLAPNDPAIERET